MVRVPEQTLFIRRYWKLTSFFSAQGVHQLVLFSDFAHQLPPVFLHWSTHCFYLKKQDVTLKNGVLRSVTTRRGRDQDNYCKYTNETMNVQHKRTFVKGSSHSSLLCFKYFFRLLFIYIFMQHTSTQSYDVINLTYNFKDLQVDIYARLSVCTGKSWWYRLTAPSFSCSQM